MVSSKVNSCRWKTMPFRISWESFSEFSDQGAPLFAVALAPELFQRSKNTSQTQKGENN